MKKLNEKTWNEFYLNDIFSFKLAKGDNQPKNMSQGRFPVVSAGETNNGVTAFVSNPDEGSTFQSGTITVDMFGKAFWHGYDYCAVSHGRVNILDLNTPNDSSQFISICIDKGTISKYSYNQMCSQKRLTSQKVMLPVDDGGKPDYDYMAQYASEMRGACSCGIKITPPSSSPSWNIRISLRWMRRSEKSFGLASCLKSAVQMPETRTITT